MHEMSREIYPFLVDDFHRPEITILVGARQVGKTFLLRKLYRHALVQKLRARFFDLEQPDHLMLFNCGESEIVRLLTEGLDAVFLDEFYYLKNASHIFKAIFDSGRKVKIFASGSSALEIHRHMNESLAGRKRVFHIYPCGFAEMKQSWGKETLRTYLRFGGLPGLAGLDEPERLRLLSDIVQSYVLKDIKSLIREENIRAFNHLLYLLAQNQGSLISVAGLAREIGLTQKTVESHLNILQQTRVAFPVCSFSSNLGNELKKSRKSYLFDIGIRNMLLKDFRAGHERLDGGAILETFVFLELNRQVDPISEIRFWRTKDGREVDFIFIRNREPFPVEVKSTVRADMLPPGLSAFLGRYPKTRRAFVLNLTTEAEIQFGKTQVLFKRIEDTVRFRQWVDEEVPIS
jgi:uncharacterized protein